MKMLKFDKFSGFSGALKNLRTRMLGVRFPQGVVFFLENPRKLAFSGVPVSAR
jgi:hypothetical protein